MRCLRVRRGGAAPGAGAAGPGGSGSRTIGRSGATCCWRWVRRSCRPGSRCAPPRRSRPKRWRWPRHSRIDPRVPSLSDRRGGVQRYGTAWRRRPGLSGMGPESRSIRRGRIRRASQRGHRAGQLRVRHRRPSEAASLIRRALTVARSLADPETLFRCAFRVVQWITDPDAVDEQRRIADEFCDQPGVGVSAQTLGQLWWYSGYFAYLGAGERDRWEKFERRLAELAERTRDPGLLWRPMISEIAMATFDGPREALELAEQPASGGRSWAPWQPPYGAGDELPGPVLSWPRRGITRIRVGGPRGLRAQLVRAHTLAQAGRMAEAREALRALWGTWLIGSAEQGDPRPDHTLETAVLDVSRRDRDPCITARVTRLASRRRTHAGYGDHRYRPAPRCGGAALGARQRARLLPASDRGLRRLAFGPSSP